MPLPTAAAQCPIPARPLTCDRSQGFATTTTEYYQHIVDQDWKQLVQQPSSICDPNDAMSKNLAFKALKSFIPDSVNPKYDRCKFKLIYDDLGLANLIFRSKEDLKIVVIVDLEWPYIGPAQLSGSAPWWLLQDRSTNCALDCNTDGKEPPDIAARYSKYLEIFIRVLEEEEAKLPGHEEKEFSSLVKWSQASGAMWLYFLLLFGFNEQYSFSVTLLRRHLGTTKWAEREKVFDNAEELDAFAARKVGELDEYYKALEKRDKDKELVDNGKMSNGEFVARALMEPGYLPSCCSSFVVNGEMGKDEGFCLPQFMAS